MCISVSELLVLGLDGTGVGCTPHSHQPVLLLLRSSAPIVTMKILCLVIFSLFASTIVSAQNEEALHIPIETNNQFPPDQIESEGVIEGSGAGVIDEPVDSVTEALSRPNLESIDDTGLNKDVESTSSAADTTDSACPKPCVCSIEGDSNNYVVDCSGYGLTEFPSPIDARTTTLKLHNNKLTEIPKEISTLKNLKILNAENNSIMELASGSVSELPELVTLKLTNNRLIEYPKDLKNSISLNKLEELDLGGNDIRTVLTSEIFSNFKSLRKLTLPNATTELVLDLCSALKDTLEAVCTETCATKTFECPDAPEKLDDDLLGAVLAGTIALSNTIEENENKDPVVQTEDKNEADSNTEDGLQVSLETTVANSNQTGTNEFSLRAAFVNEPQGIGALNTIVETPKEVPEEANVGAKTVDTSGGGVDKSIIGIIIAGMIVVVAGITIKKNWSSITRFSSGQRPNEHSVAQANGNTAEEVPLQDKSPV